VGIAHVSYIPNGRVVGLSKIPRIVDMFARRLQLQERMTTDIAQTLQHYLNPQGAAVMIEATHFCLKARGIKKNQSDMQTTHYTGIYIQDRDLQKDFIQSCLKS
jgi:GTP cyclohydrolase I